MGNNITSTTNTTTQEQFNSTEKIELALSINKVLNRIYSAISNYSFDLSKVDLSDINTETLLDFWMYTAGFLCMQYSKTQEEILGEKGIKDILSGKFIITTFNQEDALNFANDVIKSLDDGTPPITPTERGRIPDTIKLVSIQDGKYYIKKNNKLSNAHFSYYDLILETTPVQITVNGETFAYSKKNLEKTNMSDIFVLKIITNVFAHTTPDNLVNTLAFHDFTKTRTVTTSKMWLRGYSELFACHIAQQGMVVEQIENQLKTYLSDSNNKLRSIKDIRKLFEQNLNLIPCAPSLQQKTIGMFVSRIENQQLFYSMPLNKKLQFIAQIINKDRCFYQNQHGIINPSIIYSIQQLVSKELDNRNLDDLIVIDQTQSHRIKEHFNHLRNIESEITNTNQMLTKLRNISNSQLNFLKAKIRHEDQNLAKVVAEGQKLVGDLIPFRKVATSLMKMFDANDLEFLNIETASHIAFMMAYNSIIISGFYEDILSGKNYDKLTKPQMEFLDKLNKDMNPIKVTTRLYDEINHTNNPIIHADVLNNIRHCLRHSQYMWNPPFLKYIENATFRDTFIQFKDNLVISSDAQKLVDLFGNVDGAFFIPRPNKVLNRATFRYDSPSD